MEGKRGWKQKILLLKSWSLLIIDSTLITEESGEEMRVKWKLVKYKSRNMKILVALLESSVKLLELS